MAILTGLPLGTINAQEDLYLDGAPKFYFGGVVYNNPDSDGFYWGLTGSVANPVYEVGCFTDFTFKDNVTVNDIICDKLGHVGVIQKRGYLEVTFKLQSLLPLTTLTKILRLGTVTTNSGEGAEKVGIGDVTGKNSYYPVYFERVYDEDTNDYFAFHGHRAQFVNAWEIGMPYADKWSIGITMRIFADSTKPVAQKFGVFVRYDPSVL